MHVQVKSASSDTARPSEPAAKPRFSTAEASRTPAWARAWDDRPPALVSAAPIQTKLSVSQPNDPYEQEADLVANSIEQTQADRIMVAHPPPGRQRPAVQARETGDGPNACVSESIRDTLRDPGRPLDTKTRAFMEPRFGYYLGHVRIHSDPQAALSAQAVRARAYTLGDQIVFGSGQYQPNTIAGKTLLAHELTHVVQQARSPAASSAVVQRAPDTTPALKPGDRVPMTVSASSGAAPEPLYSKTYILNAAGAIEIDDGSNRFSIPVAGLGAQAAADKIAARFVSEQLLLAPRVCLTAPGGSSPVCTQLQLSDLDQAYANFVNYIATTKEPVDAVLRYYKWIDDHRGKPELKSITPADLWTQSLQTPARPADPRADKTDEYLRFVKYLQGENAKITDPKEKARATETVSRFLDWYDKNKDLPTFPQADLAKVYADLSVGVLKKSIDAAVARQVEAQREAARNSPAVLQARAAKFDEFFALARQLWGYSARTFPYSIPLDSEGKDILVTGDPALQKVLNALASDLASWASGHMFDDNFSTTNPKAVLVDLLKGGYSQKLAEAQKTPLEHETIDRNQILPGKALAAFGETVATGLLAIAVVGLFVGAEVITAGQATWILVGVAGAGGVKSFLDRREEVEKTGYDVPIPETIVYSAGDAIGVSQLVEGITGQRLGTNVPLGSEARSGQLGAGAGNVATLLIGSKAYRAGEGFGVKFRATKPGLTPPGPNASANVELPKEVIPPTPQPSVNPGPVEASLRAGLSDATKVGFDRWMADIRARGGEPETVLKALSKERVQTVAEQFAKKQATEVARGEEAARVRARAKDDPLRPILKNVEKKGNVTIHYETTPPSQAEIAAAQEIATRTGEEVHLFGDTASKVTYPGIDGTIGNPPRPLSIKAHSVDANAGSGRFAAQEALVKAKTNGYTQVEVEISLPGKTVAEVQAAWDVGPTRPGDHPLAPVYEGDVVAKVTVRCSDGVWVVPKGPALTGVVPQSRRPEEKPK